MFIVVDVGGTKTRLAGSDDLRQLGEPVILDTPPQYEAGIAAIAERARALSGGAPIEAVAAGVPGVFSPGKRTLLKATNLPGWERRELADDLERALASRVVIENDTALVGLGEAVHGAGKGAEIVAYVTVSTGVGGVRIVEGKIDRSAQGFEIGGQYLDMTEPRTLESYLSGRRVEERFGKPPKELGADNPLWEELARILGFGVHNTILHWSPERVVLGGSMCNDVGIDVERVAAHVAGMLKKFPHTPEIVHSQLGDVGGLWGGLARLKQVR